MRAFIAIELSPEIKDSLDQVQSHLKYSGANVKWVSPGDIHLTLKFIGDITEEICEKIRLALNKIGSSFKPFEIGIKGVGAFPNVNYPRVIWVGLDMGTVETKALSEKICEELLKLGFQKEPRPFAPHLTIGRVRSPENKDILKEKLISAQLPITKTHSVSSIVLFQSTLSTKGPVYTKLHEVRLG